MTKQYLFFVLVAGLFVGCQPREESVRQPQGLKDAFAGKFYIGTAINTQQISGDDSLARAVVDRHFSSIVAENCMKSENLQPRPGEFFFDDADAFVTYGEQHGHFIVGHTLVWHSQAPDWLFINEDGTDVSREELIRRMREHISTVVGRYRGRVHGWDVVNEAITDDGEYRQSKWYEIIGEDYIRLAFEFAREADPEAELYYNDYSMANPGRRAGVVRMVKQLQAQGVKIDGIGMQAHCNLDYPPLEEFEASLEAFSELGVKVMITELDLTVLPWPGQRVTADVALSEEFKAEYDPFTAGLPDSVQTAFNERYKGFFGLFLKHSDKISRVTLWGVSDSQSWRNYWPVRGRTDYPLLFDRNYQPKPVVDEIMRMAAEQPSEQ